MSKIVRRLFSGFQPNHYAIDLHPDREAMRVSGEVVITGKKAGRPSQRLTFHQNGLKITAAQVIRNDKRGDQELPVTRINHHKGYDEVRLHSAALLYAGQYTVRMSFE